MGKEKVHISLVVIGHVDAGKSIEGSGEGTGSLGSVADEFSNSVGQSLGNVCSWRAVRGPARERPPRLIDRFAFVVRLIVDPSSIGDVSLPRFEKGLCAQLIASVVVTFRHFPLLTNYDSLV
jgi:hypothetical protein